MTRAVRAAGLVLAVCCLPGPLKGQDPGPVVDRAQSAYDSTRTLTAEFTQVITNPLIGSPDTTRGTLHQMRPSSFEMRFAVPRGDRIVADGHYLWLYTPSTTPGQVIRSGIPRTGTGPNLFGQFVDHARERYTIRYIRTDTLAADGLADVIALEPRSADLPYRRAVLWVNRLDALVRRLEITEQSGQERVITLHAVRVNEAVPAEDFKFSVPRGVRVVDQ
ncbi:MAG TPA: outer membrane lipoprotein carrier protein LolA [Gemmatimonadales bacterium]|nr:outer membrane lipoprotein carrier protein LolA [Gemmatimonadales bacterium]